jgi:flagellar assembly factor FliW
VRFETTRFGVVEVDEATVLRFERGMPGFPECTSFVVMDHDRETPLKWLQSVERPEVAFLVVEPEQVLGSFEVDVPPEALTLLGWNEGDDPRSLAVFVILNVEDGDLTANLRAPVVAHVGRRRAAQLILEDAQVPFRHPIRPTRA